MIRLALGLAVLVVLALFLDWSFVAGLSPGQYVLCGVVAVALVCCTWFEAERLYALCQGRFPRAEILRMVLIGHFLTNFTPSGLGGDGYKVYALAAKFGFSGGAALVLLERALGLAVLLSVSFGAALFYGEQWASDVMRLRDSIELPGSWSGTRAWVVAAAAALVLAALWIWRSRVLRFATDFLLTLRGLPLSAVGRFCAMTLCLHLSRSILLCLLLQAFGYGLGVGEAWLVLTVAALASTMPITPGALGVREAATIGVLVPFGVDYHVALLASLVMRLANVGSAAVGAMLIPGGRRPGQAAKDSPDG